MARIQINLTNPNAEPIDVQQAKDWMRIDGTDNDATVAAVLSAAITHVENDTNSQVRPATINLYLDTWPGREINLPRPPFIPPSGADSGITYIDPAGSPQTVDPTAYTFVASRPAKAVLNAGQSWPQTSPNPDAITITYHAGHDAAGHPLPADLRIAILMLAGHWFEHREAAMDRTVTEIPFAVRAILDKYRMVDVC